MPLRKERWPGTMRKVDPDWEPHTKNAFEKPDKDWMEIDHGRMSGHWDGRTHNKGIIS